MTPLEVEASRPSVVEPAGKEPTGASTATTTRVSHSEK